MIKSARLSVLLPVLGLLACGHSHGGVKVVVEASPSPFVGDNGCSIAMSPIVFDGWLVEKKSEADYVASLKPQDQAHFTASKKTANANFLETVVKEGAPFTSVGPSKAVPWVGVVKITSWKAGSYYGPYTYDPGVLEADLQIQNQAGNVIDEWTAKLNPNMGFATMGGDAQLEWSGRLLAKVFGKEITKRFKCTR